MLLLNGRNANTSIPSRSHYHLYWKWPSSNEPKSDWFEKASGIWEWDSFTTCLFLESVKNIRSEKEVDWDFLLCQSIDLKLHIEILCLLSRYVSKMCFRSYTRYLISDFWWKNRLMSKWQLNSYHWSNVCFLQIRINSLLHFISERNS